MSPELYIALKKMFPAGEYAFLQEVRDAAGHQASNSADAIAMALWPSRGLVIHGMEVKASRGDWFRELKQPEKAEAIYKYCDYFWLVAEDESVVLNITEIPSSWGYMFRNKKGMKIMKEATKLTPLPLTNTFVAAMLKRATKDLIHPNEIKDKLNEAREEGKQISARTVKNLTEDLTAVNIKIRAFEQAAGIRFSTWEYKAGQIGHIVNQLSSQKQNIFEDFKTLQKKYENALHKINDALAEVSKYENIDKVWQPELF